MATSEHNTTDKRAKTMKAFLVLAILSAVICTEVAMPDYSNNRNIM